MSRHGNGVGQVLPPQSPYKKLHFAKKKNTQFLCPELFQFHPNKKQNFNQLITTNQAKPM
jgi:hypothetical protein